jgi:murein L,D-transpeptidase YcbB/YkuD
MNLLAHKIRPAVTIAVTIMAAFFIFLWPAMGMANTVTNALSEQIQKRFDAAVESPLILREGATAHAPGVLSEIYAARSFRPAWINSQGPLAPAETLLNAIGQAGQEGLEPEEYHLAAMTALVSAWRTSREHNLPFPIARQIDLELLLTDALVAYGFHLLNGRVDPERFYPDWFSYQKDVSLLDVIENAVNTGNVEAGLRRLTPQEPLYRGLKQALAVYVNIAKKGGWPELPQSRNLWKKADHRRYSLLLKQRLLLTGDLPPAESTGSNEDENMKKALRRFQKRHGIKADGTISPATLKAMNVPVGERIRQMTLNMERLRWLPEDVGNRYILVNIADFELIVSEDGLIVMDMPIVVGKQNQRTSVFSGKMTYLELNPYWNIPKAIAEKEILPEVQKDPAYLTKKKIRVIEYRRDQDKEIDPATIDWSKIRPDKLRYSFRQDYGPGNALGRIKFMFPNKFDIYLHDTPERHLFKRSRRTFSHGCIRIARPIDLAEYLLKNENGWDRRKILAEIGNGKRQILKLSHPIDIHILYLTAWTDLQGIVQFRNDVYEGDETLLRTLSEKPRTLYPDDIRKPKEIPNPYGERF